MKTEEKTTKAEQTPEVKQSFVDETNVDILSAEETASELAQNIVESSDDFERKISAFAPKLKAQSRALRNAIEQGVSATLNMAKILYAIDEQKLLKGTNYKGLGEYAESLFGIQKSQASKLKNAYKRFFAVPLTTSDGVQLSLNAGQASEMLAADDDTIQAMVDSGELNDSMSAKEIREAIKARKPKKDAPVKVYNWAMCTFADGLIVLGEQFAQSEDYIYSIFETGAKAQNTTIAAITKTDGNDMICAIYNNGTFLAYSNLGEVKPEKKTKEAK